jgi:hypothetical protein
VHTATRRTSRKKSEEKYYATAFRGKQGHSRNNEWVLLWGEEGKYWKIVAIRMEDSDDSGLTPARTPITTQVSEVPTKFVGALHAGRNRDGN